MKISKFIYAILISLTLTSCTIDEIPKDVITDGKDGENGINGFDGEDGNNGLATGHTLNGYILTIFQYYESNGIIGWQSNETQYVVQVIDLTPNNGENGNDGVDGNDGQDGNDGANGTDGINGEDGVDGNDGADGVDGSDGNNGIDGRTTVFRFLPILVGADCDHGGMVVEWGFDTVGGEDGVLQDYEVMHSNTICNVKCPPVCNTTIETIQFNEDFEIVEEGEIIKDTGIAKWYAMHPKRSGNHAMGFNTDRNPSTGGDSDLNLFTGIACIISEDLDGNDPDDNVSGGVITGELNHVSTVKSFDLLDNEKKGGYYIVHTTDNKSLRFDLPTMPDKTKKTVQVGIENVTKIEFVLKGSGAIDNIRGSYEVEVNNCK